MKESTSHCNLEKTEISEIINDSISNTNLKVEENKLPIIAENIINETEKSIEINEKITQFQINEINEKDSLNEIKEVKKIKLKLNRFAEIDLSFNCNRALFLTAMKK